MRTTGACAYMFSDNVGGIVRRGVGAGKLHRLPAHAPAARRGSLGEAGDTRSALVYTGSGDGYSAVGDVGEVCEQLIDCGYAVADVQQCRAVALVQQDMVVRVSDRRVDRVAAQQA